MISSTSSNLRGARNTSAKERTAKSFEIVFHALSDEFRCIDLTVHIIITTRDREMFSDLSPKMKGSLSCKRAPLNSLATFSTI